jgi:hypothetical protein
MAWMFFGRQPVQHREILDVLDVNFANANR